MATIIATTTHSYHFHFGRGHRDDSPKLAGALYGLSSIPTAYHGSLDQKPANASPSRRRRCRSQRWTKLNAPLRGHDVVLPLSPSPTLPLSAAGTRT